MKRLTILAASVALGSAPAWAGEPAAEPAAIASPRLEAARETVDYIFPLGTYARIMDKTMDTVMASMMDSVGDMKLREVAAMGGLPEGELAKLGDGTMREITEIFDPAYQLRMDRTMRTMMSEMGTLMSRFEPEIREGLAEAYAERFSPNQLAELNGFFATPTGRAYAAESMVIFMDPKVMTRMQAFMPEMVKEMPRLMEQVTAATADLPKPRKLRELNDAERARLAQLLGVEESELETMKAIPGQPQG